MRYTRTIKEQIDIVERHADWKVKQLIRYSKRCAKLQEILEDKTAITPELEALLLKMYAIAQELKEVDQWVRGNYPQVIPIYETSLTLIKEQ